MNCRPLLKIYRSRRRSSKHTESARRVSYPDIPNKYLSKEWNDRLNGCFSDASWRVRRTTIGPVPAADARLPEGTAGAVTTVRRAVTRAESSVLLGKDGDEGAWRAGNAFSVSTLVSNPASPSVIYQHLP